METDVLKAAREKYKITMDTGMKSNPLMKEFVQCQEKLLVSEEDLKYRVYFQILSWKQEAWT